MNLETIIAGDTLDFTVSVPDYPPADGWTLKYRLTPRFATPAQTPITLTATTSGSDYLVQAAPATTTAWVAGSYAWARWVEKAGARQTLDESGSLVVKPDPALTAAGYDGRSHARIMLDAIEAVLQGRATKTQKSYTIGSRAIEFLMPKELEDWRSAYRSEVRSEEVAAGNFTTPRLGARL